MKREDFECHCDKCNKMASILYEDENGNYICLKCLRKKCKMEHGGIKGGIQI